MSRLLSRHALWSVLVVVVCGLVACGHGRVQSASRPVPPGRPSDDTSATTSTIAGPADDADDHDDSGLLTPPRRVQLGLTNAGGAGALTPQQWSDPQAVAAHWVLADTTYAAAEDRAAVNARRAAYATARLAADLATTSSSGGARLEELRRRQALYAGEVLAVTTSQSSVDRAVVRVRAAVTLTTSDQPPGRRARFYQITLGRDPGGRWLVARAEQS